MYSLQIAAGHSPRRAAASLRVIKRTQRPTPKIKTVTLRAGAFDVDAASVELLRTVFSDRVNVDAEMCRAASWCAENMPRTRNYAPFVCAWLKRAADDAALQIAKPKLYVIAGVSQ